MKNILYWILAFVITLASAYYQRISGPTYPESGSHNGVNYKFERSHSGSSDQVVEFNIPESENPHLHWKRYKSNDEWTSEKMNYNNGKAVGYLPGQPPAGKIEYYVTSGNTRFPAEHNVITRFKGDVPPGIIIPHVFLIFLAMLLSLRTGIEALVNKSNLKKYTLITIIVVALGGMVFGPLTQLYAFNALWTGFPFGYDLTDNKTLIAFIGWLIAGYAVYKNKRPKLWVVVAAVLMFVIFLIPHSVLGSEIDYTKVNGAN